MCFDCHGQTTSYPQDADHEGKRPPDCVECHGYNGATHADHAVLENDGCTECHLPADLAHVAAFEVPQDCVACHNQSDQT